MTGARVAVLELGGTHVTAAWVCPDGWQVSELQRVELDPHAGADVLLGELAAAGARLDAPAGSRWGLAVPGPFDYRAGIARYTGVGKFDGLTGVAVGAELADRLPGRPQSMSFINDASAFLLGEWLAGSARGADRCAAITLGTGVGSAFLDSGRVVDTGPDVPPDGEVHLLSHDGLPLEDWVSRRALRRSYSGHAARPDDTDVKEIAELARAGDPAAAAAFDGAFTVLGEALGPWLVRFGAERLVVGGSIAGAWDLIERPLRAGLSAYADDRLAIGLAADPERSPLIGAAAIA